ncbi:MAG: Lon protease family protein [Anaerolineae bacterium]
MKSKLRLAPEKLYRPTDPERFEFQTTEELEPLSDAVGQPRAVTAIRFGMDIQSDGYNIFALGPPGTGKRDVIQRLVERRAASMPVPDDWCYVNNFEDPHKPKAIRLPAGVGVDFRTDMEELIEDLQTALSSAFESEEYQTRRQTLMEEFKEKQSQAFEELQSRAQDQGVALIRTPAGLAVAPIREGEVLSPEEIQELPKEERARLQENIAEIQDDLQKILQRIPRWQREMRKRLDKLNHEMANLAVGGLIDELREKYSAFPEVIEHLDTVQEDVVEHANEFLPSQEGEGASAMKILQRHAGQTPGGEASSLYRYEVNVIVDHSGSEGAPVIYEGNPTYQNLIGRVEHQARMGALYTDFRLIKPGALHRANGGYLILDARKVLNQPYAWEGLKRALQSGEMRIESLGQMLSLISTISLEPEPIPLKAKIVLFGDPLLYYLLWELDPEFAQLFKVQADFEDQMERTSDQLQLYARLIATLAKRKDLRPLDRSAVARVVEHSARLVEDAEKLSTRTRDISDLLCEADYWADQNGHEVITRADVQQAIDAQIYRGDRLRERIQEAILRDTLLIDTEGEKVAQVNGLSVIQLGNFAFGRPTRITARTRLGKGEVLDIEREVELGGPIHSKGVLILSGFLGARYAENTPLSLSASLVFEQSYSDVEGDSASTAELYALLSSIANVPLKQSLAVTGSVNQHGQVQAIGGVNEKIEGFFDICKARGLTGDQGVLIPAANVKHLMLRQDVVEAVRNGDFHVYAISTVDEGLELLSGLPAGERDAEGNYPEGTFNYRVQRRVQELAERREISGEDEGEEA